MAFESFYGGRPGASIVIRKVYSSFAELKQDFARGGNSTNNVNYGEYAVISNVENKLEHGKVYRREVNYQDAENNFGAVYCGKMCGPQGEPGGIHIIGLVSTIDALEGKTPESIGGSDDYKGWVMAVGEPDAEENVIPDLYAYDYADPSSHSETYGWFYIGNLPYAPVMVTRKTVDYDEIN